MEGVDLQIPENSMSTGTIDLARDGWKHASELHTCRHCQKIIFRQDHIGDQRANELDDHGCKPWTRTEFIRLPHTKAEALEAAQEDCPVFMGIGESRLKHTRWKLLRILFKYPWASQFEGAEKSYTCSWPTIDILSKAFHGRRLRLLNMALDNMLSPNFYLFSPSHTSGVELFYSICGVGGNRAVSPCVQYGKYPIRNNAMFRTFTINDVASEQSIALVKERLDECRSLHPECVIPASDFLPTRLLELGAHGAVRLVEPDRNSVNYNTWVALSYVWGGDQHCKTTLTRLDSYHEEILVDALPQTISDAITVCRFMGISYLWVDCLCIVQDAPEDILNELQTMASIYKHAIFTISAASSRSSKEGFLHCRPFYYKHFPPTSLKCCSSNGEQPTALVLTETDYSRYVPDPINERSWTFQEYLLSQRVLIYSSRELIWRCQQTLTTTTGEGRTLQYQGAKWKNWEADIENYSTTIVTFPLDKIVALSAVASTYHDRNKDCKTYLAGLWKENLPSCLLWFVQDRIPRRRRRPEYIAPSWSWASVDGPIYYSKFPFSNCYDGRKTKILDAKTVLTSPDAPFGAVTDGLLVIKGKCKVIKFKTDYDAYKKWKSGDTKHISMKYDRQHIPMQSDDRHLLVYPDADENCWLHACLINLDAVLLELRERKGILLLKLEDDRYRRVGWYERTPGNDINGKPMPSYKQGFETQRVTII